MNRFASTKPGPRQLRWGSPEHQNREIHARDVHHSSDRLSYYGNGETVMVVGKGKRPFVEIVGENGLTATGEPFTYSDYFLPEATP